MYRHDPMFLKDVVKARDRAGVVPLSEFAPEDDRPAWGLRLRIF